LDIELRPQVSENDEVFPVLELRDGQVSKVIFAQLLRNSLPLILKLACRYMELDEEAAFLGRENLRALLESHKLLQILSCLNSKAPFNIVGVHFDP